MRESGVIESGALVYLATDNNRQIGIVVRKRGRYVELRFPGRKSTSLHNINNVVPAVILERMWNVKWWKP